MPTAARQTEGQGLKTFEERLKLRSDSDVSQHDEWRRTAPPPLTRRAVDQ
jgi:hypothetical protein